MYALSHQWKLQETCRLSDKVTPFCWEKSHVRKKQVGVSDFKTEEFLQCGKNTLQIYRGCICVYACMHIYRCVYVHTRTPLTTFHNDSVSDLIGNLIHWRSCHATETSKTLCCIALESNPQWLFPNDCISL